MNLIEFIIITIIIILALIICFIIMIYFEHLNNIDVNNL